MGSLNCHGLIKVLGNRKIGRLHVYKTVGFCKRGQKMIKHRKSTPYYPRCDGQANSTNKTLKEILTKIVQNVNHMH